MTAPSDQEIASIIETSLGRPVTLPGEDGHFVIHISSPSAAKTFLALLMSGIEQSLPQYIHTRHMDFMETGEMLISRELAQQPEFLHFIEDSSPRLKTAMKPPLLPPPLLGDHGKVTRHPFSSRLLGLSPEEPTNALAKVVRIIAGLTRGHAVETTVEHIPSETLSVTIDAGEANSSVELLLRAGVRAERLSESGIFQDVGSMSMNQRIRMEFRNTSELTKVLSRAVKASIRQNILPRQHEAVALQAVQAVADAILPEGHNR